MHKHPSARIPVRRLIYATSFIILGLGACASSSSEDPAPAEDTDVERSAPATRDADTRVIDASTIDVQTLDLRLQRRVEEEQKNATPRMRLRALFSRNQAAFSVRVLGAKVETDATGHIFTNTSCIVTKVLAEVAPSTPPLQPNLELVVRTLGGRVENVTQFASHQPQLLAGAEYLLVTSALDRTTITGIADFQTLRISENSTSWMGVTVPSEDITDALSLLGTEYP